MSMSMSMGKDMDGSRDGSVFRKCTRINGVEGGAVEPGGGEGA